ncbi:unnamed protein product [Adineta ricciae]|uniref:ATP-grasp domain-containing protein n=1 Tax=Adineta ricciae TaxID=249248 RepID=A0A815PEN3_ADIRI|nr:unnamed protein product [Adineta ricciae]CAF1448248.1 unnamed protein product [Adineta ricciae]
MVRCSTNEKVRRAGKKFLKNDGIYLERLVDNARHIEIQIFGDGQGHVIGLSERDCSLQRRHQKIVKEVPASNLSDDNRSCLQDAAIRLGSLIRYRSAGTVEFVYDRDSNEIYFLEVNCRLQVKHSFSFLRFSSLSVISGRTFGYRSHSSAAGLECTLIGPTFVLGKFGGYAGRLIKSGDTLHIDSSISHEIPANVSKPIIPTYPNIDSDEEW